MKEKAMQSMSTLSSAQIVAGLPHPAYHHTVHFARHAPVLNHAKNAFTVLLLSTQGMAACTQWI